MSIAIGVIGMSYDTFVSITPSVLKKTYEGWLEREKNNMQMNWERTRMEAYIALTPHLKKNVQPRDIMPFTWDKKQNTKPKTAEEDRADFERILKEYNIER